tara:strand:+ start:20008 stop:20985 length:978 start_codon:yes stop_codon:yes gene_type:complete
MKFSRPIQVSTWISALLLAGACGGGGGGDIDVKDLGSELSDTICDAQIKCGAYPNKATCLEATRFEVDQLISDVEAGLINYDGAKARECVNSVLDLFGADCTRFPSGPGNESACDEAFEGTIALGEACFTDESCAGSASCSGSGGETCTQGVCEASEPEPAEAAEGESCTETECEFGLYCNPDDVCTALHEPAEACPDFFSCVSGYICDLGPDFTPGTCVEMPDTGDTCDPEFGGPFVGGQLSCLRITDYCDPADTKCKTKLSPGSACGEGLLCADYAECVDDACVARPRLGEACEVDSELTCLGDLDCASGTCVAEPSDPVCAF